MSIDDLFEDAERLRHRAAFRRHAETVAAFVPVPEISAEAEAELFRRIFAADGE